MSKRSKRIKEEIKRRREEIVKYRSQLPREVPKRLWRNVPLEVYDIGLVEMVLCGDDYVDDGKVKRVELRLGEPIALSFIKRWIEGEGLLKALHWILSLNRAAEPPRAEDEDELSKRISEKIAELKAALRVLEDVRKKYECS